MSRFNITYEIKREVVPREIGLNPANLLYRLNKVNLFSIGYLDLWRSSSVDSPVLDQVDMSTDSYKKRDFYAYNR